VNQTCLYPLVRADIATTRCVVVLQKCHTIKQFRTSILHLSSLPLVATVTHTIQTRQTKPPPPTNHLSVTSPATLYPDDDQKQTAVNQTKLTQPPHPAADRQHTSHPSPTSTPRAPRRIRARGRTIGPGCRRSRGRGRWLPARFHRRCRGGRCTSRCGCWRTD